MTYKCNCCGAEFDMPHFRKEWHCGYSYPPEVWAECPECGDSDIEEKIYGEDDEEC